MAMKMYDLAAGDPAIRFSPNCWRTRMAVAHKGMALDCVPWRFTEKEAIAFSGKGTVPILVDGETTVVDSWDIAEYLDRSYPNAPKLFDSPEAKAYARFINNWTARVLHGGVAKQILEELFAFLDETDKAYFRESREKAFGMPLEQFWGNADEVLPGFRATLAPLRATLEQQPFLAGDAPAYADHVVFGAFQWARVSSTKELLEAGDPIAAWREKMLDAYGGIARQMPARAA